MDKIHLDGLTNSICIVLDRHYETEYEALRAAKNAIERELLRLFGESGQLAKWPQSY